MSTNLPVPNVVIEDPRTRKRVRTAIDIVGVVLSAIIAFDAASGYIDLAGVTAPAMAAWSVLRLAFGIGVDNKNTPVGKRGVYED